MARSRTFRDRGSFRAVTSGGQSQGFLCESSGRPQVYFGVPVGLLGCVAAFKSEGGFATKAAADEWRGQCEAGLVR